MLSILPDGALYKFTTHANIRVFSLARIVLTAVSLIGDLFLDIFFSFYRAALNTGRLVARKLSDGASVKRVDCDKTEEKSA